MFLSPEILTLQILNFVFLFFSSIAFYLSLKIYLSWDIHSTSKKQYKLEKQSYLTSVIIKYIFIIKLPIFLFFIFTLDKLSDIVTGAMCAAGIVDAATYGSYLLTLKIINLYLFGFWLIMHNKDIKEEKLPYTKQKFGLFLIIFVLFIFEIIVEVLMFNNFDISQLVSCCGTLYSSNNSSYISALFQVDNSIIVGIFYINFLVMIGFYFFKQKELFALSNVFYLLTSIIGLSIFFGTYIYELPTHHCPFCFLQQEYYHIGYLIYILLFIGTFNGIVSGFMKDNKRSMNNSLLFNFLYLLLVSSYPIVFYIKNGVWL